MEMVSEWDGCIFLASPLMGFFDQMYQETGLDYDEFCLIMHENKAEEWADQDALRRCTDEVLRREREAPGYLSRLVEAFETKKAMFLEHSQALDSMDLAKVSDEALLGHLGTFIHLYRDQYVLPVITFFYKEHLSEMLYGRLSERMGDNAADAISFVTTPDQESFSFEERKAMLRLMGRMYDSLGKELFDKTPEEAVGILKGQQPKLYEYLVDHSRRYFWINNNYKRVFVLGPLDFLRKMKAESISFSHPGEELSHMESARKEALKKKSEYLELLDPEERLMAEILAQGGWWQDERKKCNLIGDHILMKFLREVSRRKGIPIETLMNATVSEIGPIMHRSADIGDIRERHKSEFTLYSKVRSRYVEIAMVPGRRYFESKVERMDEFRGTPASPGTVEGKVVVIKRENEFGKMEDGRILVSVMTRPEYTPIMKKAAGIITDEGGLTCHAAVVSREFKVPCIVGTKIATRVLKDGDIVRIEADKGRITVIRG